MKLSRKILTFTMLGIFIGVGVIPSIANSIFDNNKIYQCKDEFCSTKNFFSYNSDLILIRPRIEEIQPNPVELYEPIFLSGGFRIEFFGGGNKTIDSGDPYDGSGCDDEDSYSGIGDEYIKTFLWSSNIDGNLSDKLSFSTDTLSPGNHIISFSVCSQNGKWTPSVSESITVIKSDLECFGSLSFNNVEPNGIVTGSFTVRNVGDTGSRLDWRVDSYPSWGDWTFAPENGNGLTPGDEAVTVKVFVSTPDVEDASFFGDITVVNEKDSSDYETISVSLSTPKNKGIFNSFLQFFEKALQYNLNLFVLLRNIKNI